MMAVSIKSTDNDTKQLKEFIANCISRHIPAQLGNVGKNETIGSAKAKRILERIMTEDSLDMLEHLMNNEILENGSLTSNKNFSNQSTLEHLVAKRDSLKESYGKSKKKLDLLKRDAFSLRDQVVSSSRERHLCSEDFQMTKRKTSLLKLQLRHCKQRCDVYDNATKRVEGKCARHNVDNASTKMNNTFLSSNIGKQQMDIGNLPVLESTCLKQLKTVCSAVSEYLHILFSTESNNAENIEVPSYDKNKIWSQIENLMANQSPLEILNNLVNLCDISSLKINAMTDNVNLVKDASHLRFKFESGSLTDISNESSLLHSVKDLIEDAQNDHFKKFIASEKALNNQSQSKEQIFNLQKDIKNIIFKAIADRNKAQLLIHALELEARSSSMLAGLKYLEETINTLKNQLIERKESVSMLLRKYQKISEFEELAERKQQMIQALVRHNGNARSRLEKQCTELCDNRSNKISPTIEKLVSAMSRVLKCHSEELDVFLTAPTFLLHQIDINGTRSPVHLLSCNRFRYRHLLPGNTAITHLLASAGIKDCYSTDRILQAVMNLVKRDLMLEEELFTIRQNSSKMILASKDGDVEKLKDLRSISSRIGNDKLSSMVSICNKEVTETTAALTDSNELRRIIQSWIDQPAKYLTPWLEENNMNIEKWQQQWSFQIAQLKQLQLNG